MLSTLKGATRRNLQTRRKILTWPEYQNFPEIICLPKTNPKSYITNQNKKFPKKSKFKSVSLPKSVKEPKILIGAIRRNLPQKLPK
jgi:hypothetical protein